MSEKEFRVSDLLSENYESFTSVRHIEGLDPEVTFIRKLTEEELQDYRGEIVDVSGFEEEEVAAVSKTATRSRNKKLQEQKRKQIAAKNREGTKRLLREYRGRLIALCLCDDEGGPRFPNGTKSWKLVSHNLSGDIIKELYEYCCEYNACEDLILQKDKEDGDEDDDEEGNE